MFTTKNTQEKTFVSKFITPGIHENVIIESVTGGTVESTGNPFLEWAFRLSTSSPEETTKVRFFMSEKAREKSLEKVVHIVSKVANRKDLDAINTNSITDYAKAINKLVGGKTLRMKFIGEEYLNANSELKTRSSLGLPAFAEATVSGGDYAPVTATKLKFDPSNGYDFKRLVNPDIETTTAGNGHGF